MGVKRTSLMRFCIGILIMVMGFHGCGGKKDAGAKNNGILMNPSSIEIHYNDTVVKFNETDDEYKEIFDLVKRDWGNSLNQGRPIIVQLLYMNKEDIDNIRLEVRFIYDEPIEWTRGNVTIQSRIYSFFPLDNEYAAITANGEYESEAVIVKFSPSDDLKDCLANYTG